MIDFQPSTFLLQWATGGLLFLWVSNKTRLIGLGFGWTTRITYLVIAGIGLVVGVKGDTLWLREISNIGLLMATSFALLVSIARRKAGVKGQRELQRSRADRVSAMLGDRGQIKVSNTVTTKEFPPVLDLIAPVIGTFGLVVGAVDAAGSIWLSVARTLVGAAFLGAVSNSMLLGHWYLVQPGLSRNPIFTLVNWTGLLWLPELVLLCIPTGMFSVLNGTIDDNYNGLLGWFWVACVVATICLVIVTRMALKEKEYSAVMAATGLMYLAILTAFGMDLVARILLDA
ncbi:MAG: hypothetical protein VYD10_01920 [Actinomycetota bacterium]|nr:hypothetical protein [Acidimicrobiaceae bacterium]MEC7118234.1 hypothetical protein [Actinomycetota bacterium]MEC7153751.1 hypothetical protein [Actinomycetota bacterium]MEC7366682.1 hypothetical protein [Actinomycetota bacterium]MEC7530827.1 hypothetical protein [Actinomycetota bacterium]|tara:strand:+ start:703 stop:1560 length:858 start_codon:yes stop_codon:yes gene_type:complete